MQRNIAGGRGQVPVVVPTSIALAGFVALVSCGLRQLLRFRLQKLVQYYNLFRYGSQDPFKCRVATPFYQLPTMFIPFCATYCTLFIGFIACK